LFTPRRQRKENTTINAECCSPLRRDTASDKNGLDLLIQFIAKLLDPSQTESAALFVGDLVAKLIKKGRTLVAPILPQLLNAVTVRLADAKLPSFIQVDDELNRANMGLNIDTIVYNASNTHLFCHLQFCSAIIAACHGVCSIMPRPTRDCDQFSEWSRSLRAEWIASRFDRLAAQPR